MLKTTIRKVEVKIIIKAVSFCFVMATAILMEGCDLNGKRIAEDYPTIKGEVVVGFMKGVSQTDAEILLKSNKLEFLKTDDVNMGKKFFYETDERYVVKVPVGKETYWVEKLRKEKIVKDAYYHNDPSKILVD